MLKTMKPVIAAAAFAFATGAYAADVYQPPVVEMPPPQYVEQEVVAGGWYLRGDIGYHWLKLRGIEYTMGAGPDTNDFDSTDLDGALSLGGGIGYQITHYLRTDVTADYWFKSDFRGSTSDAFSTTSDRSSFRALLLMANAYVDLGTYRGVTPYLGAGIGGAYVKWDDLHNTIDETTVHRGAKNWRFAWALMAGASYCLTENLQLDTGYRFARIEGGRMFQYAEAADGSPAGGPGFDKGFNVHEVRAGLRYSFGGANPNCAVPQMVAYNPPPFKYEPPVYK